MAKYTKTAKVNIPIRIACILFCLTLISVYLTGGIYAKYTAASGIGDTARVISFGNITITESGDFISGGENDGKMMIIPGVDLTKKAVVDFKGSEASTYVFAEIILSSSWTTTDNVAFSISSGNKLLMQWKVEDSWKFLKTDSNGAYIYYRELEPNTHLAADIIAKDGHIYINDEITKSEISAMNGIFIKFRAACVQSNGFKSPDAAWESLSKKEE